MTALSILLLLALGSVSIIDWKFKKMPSVILTGLIFVVALVHFDQFQNGLISLSFGTLAFLYALMLYEANFVGGIADVKVLTSIGLMINSMSMFFIFLIAVVIFGFGYKLIFRYALKRDKKEEIPFIPCLYAIYITLFIIGGVA